MSDENNCEGKKQALIEFLKREGYQGVRSDTCVVEVGRGDGKAVHFNIALSKGPQNDDKGAVKVGVYVDEVGYDVSQMRKVFGNDWRPDSTTREDGKGWTKRRHGVQMWYRIHGIDWRTSYGETEMKKTLEVYKSVLAQAAKAMKL